MSGVETAAKEYGSWRRLVFEEPTTELEFFMGSTGELLVTVSNGSTLKPRKIAVAKLSVKDRAQLTRWLAEVA